MTVHRDRPAETIAVGFGIPAAAATALLAHDWIGAALLTAAAVLPAVVSGVKDYGLLGLWNRLLHGKAST